MTAVPLGDIVEIRKGKKPTLVHDTALQGSKPCILIDEVRGVTPSSYTSDEKGVEAHPEDLCIVWDGANAGTVGFGVSGFLGSTVARLRLKRPDIWDAEFIGRLLQGQFAALNEAAKGKGATIPHVDKRHLENILIPHYPLEEQKRIAAILDHADELRRKRQRAIDRVNQLGQAIFHEMFGDPVSPSNRLASNLIDIAELINGDRSSNYPSGNDIRNEGVLFLNTTNIRNGELDLTRAQFITEAKFRSLSRGKLQRGDLVITLRGTLGQCALFDCEYETGFINAQMMIIRAKRPVIPRFLREYISFPSVQDKLKAANSGSAVPQLTATQMKEMQILLPELADQRRFVEAVDTARSVRNELVTHSDWLNELFASLQHRVTQGEL